MEYKKVQQRVERLANRVYLASNGMNDAIIQFSRGDDMSFEPSSNRSSISVNGRSALFKPWGMKNDMPQARERLIANNNVVGSLIETKRDIWIGLGLVPVVKEQVNGKLQQREVKVPAAAATFFEENDFDAFLRDAFGEIAMHGMFLPEAVRNRAGNIIAVEVKKARHMRSGLKDTNGFIKSWFWCGDWSNSSRFPVKEIPVYNSIFEKSRERQSKFIMPIGYSLLTDDYYHIPIWQGSRDWIELSNLIPQFHLYNLENGFTPRWHVVIPQNYFAGMMPKKTGPMQQDLAKQEETALKEFVQDLNKYLAGLPGAGRALITEEYFEPLPKQFTGIKIKPLEVDLKDEAMLKLYEKSNQAVIAAQGIHPTLAAIETGQTRAGGSEILRALQLYLLTKTKQPRSAVLRFISFIHKINNWGEGISWVFKDETLTTLAEHPDGITEKK